MKFDFKKRGAEFGVFNNRRERHGEERVKAIDLPMRHQVTVKELDMLVPCQGVPFSEFLYGGGKKPKLQTYLLSPLKIDRRPEHVTLIIYDNDVDKRKSMKFEDVTIKDPVLEFEEDGVIYLSYKAQIHPGDLFARVSDNVEAQSRQFECRATQPELFDNGDEEGEGEEGGEDEGDGDAE